jgi:hypothetical protein
MIINSTISEALYGAQQPQSSIDFFDRCLYGDVQAFLDYALITKSAQAGNKMALEMRDAVRSFLDELYSASTNEDAKKIDYLLSNLGETKYTGIGYSTGNHDGNGVGRIIAESLRDGLLFINKVTAKGNYSFFTIPFTLDGISNDRSSDMIIALTKATIVKYTEKLAVENGWNTKLVTVKNVYNAATQQWIDVAAHLPFVDQKPVILFPKYFINDSSKIDSIFRLFKSFLFDEYIKHNIKYSSYWPDGKNFITRSQFADILKSEGMGYKSAIRDFVLSDYAIIDKFESYLDNVQPLLDSELESLQLCRTRLSA